MESTEETRRLAQDVFDYIQENPEKHDQEHYFYQPEKSTGFCGTTMCVAGTAMAIRYNFDYRAIHKAMEAKLADTGRVTSYCRMAGELLGLDVTEQDALFYEMNEELALQKLKKVIVGEPFAQDELNG
jgi:hypothetical protein